ncbi:MAG: hypothetical protein IJZ03_00505 [Clostridia bacterium]|nr:hypothetical protein [Clostridia bacterium]
MKRRYVAALLCIVMVVLTFAGCGGKYVSGGDTTEAMTVVLALVTDDIPSEKDTTLVEQALTEITSSKYNIAVQLEFYTPETYRKAMEKKLTALMALEEEGELPSSIADGYSYTINEFGRKKVKYPTPYENQVDILMITDQDMLQDFANEGWISPLNGPDALGSSEIEGSLVQKFTPQKIRQFGVYQKMTFGLPANSYYGNYEYLLVNKDLYTKYGTLESKSITDLSSITEYLVALAENEKDVIPLYNVNNLGVHTLNGDKSVVGKGVSKNDQAAVLTTENPPSSILDISSVKSQLAVVGALTDAGAEMPLVTGDVDFTKDFGACFLSGNASVVDKYSDEYHVIPVAMPLGTTENIYNSMFAMSYFTSATDRTFKVMSLLYTNAEFINTLLYGVEEVHYTRDNDNLITRIADSGYALNRYNVGNLFLTEPSADMTKEERILSLNDWAYAKQAAEDMLLTPFVGFELDYTGKPENGITLEVIDEHLEMLYDELWIKMAGYSDMVDETTGVKMTFDAFYLSLKNWLKTDPYFAAATSSDENSSNSYITQYKNWFTTYVVPPVEE